MTDEQRQARAIPLETVITAVFIAVELAYACWSAFTGQGRYRMYRNSFKLKMA